MKHYKYLRSEGIINFCIFTAKERGNKSKFTLLMLPTPRTSSSLSQQNATRIALPVKQGGL